MPVQEIRVIDSHTGGEPTRVVIDGGPDLGSGDLEQRLERFRNEHDRFRSAVVNEPRGSDVMVGAMLVEPCDPSCAAGVLFFNNTGYLGMCGHGSIGLITTLAHLGRIRAGEHRIETPVGVITAILHGDGSVSIDNVPSYRLAKDVTVQVSGDEQVTGDVAWGGNWFFLVERHGRQIALSNARALTEFTTRVRAAVNAAGHPAGRPRGALRADLAEWRELLQLRALSGRGIRPVPVWNGHQRQARLPRRRWQTP